jgi:hypothetical protein
MGSDRLADFASIEGIIFPTIDKEPRYAQAEINNSKSTRTKDNDGDEPG